MRLGCLMVLVLAAALVFVVLATRLVGGTG